MNRVLQLARLQHRAFSSYGAKCPVPLSLHVLRLLSFERRSTPDGTAVCLLRRRWGRTASVAGMLLSVSVATGVLGPAATAVWFAVVCALVGTGLRRPGWRQGARGPRGKSVYLHGLASDGHGEGERLLAVVLQEADAEGWAVELDTSCGVLVDYYRRFGFVPAGSGRGALVRMRRPCRGAEAARSSGSEVPRGVVNA